MGLVDDHVLFRQSLKNFIHHHYGDSIAIVFEADDSKDLASESPSHPPRADLILLNVQKDGLEAISFVKQHYPAAKILGLAVVFNQSFSIELLKRGVCGYLSKSASTHELMRAIDCVMHDRPFVEQRPVAHARVPAHASLSGSQLLFLRYCISELSYKEIADRMCLSVKTIDNYRDKLFRVLDVRSRTGLALYAIRSGLEEMV